MGPRHTHNPVHQHSHPASVASEEEDLNEVGAQTSPIGISPNFSAIHPQSQSGSSTRDQDYPYHLHYPHETPDVYPYESASRLDSRDRPQPSRSSSSRREKSHTKRAPPTRRPKPRSPSTEPSSESGESGDSTEDFIQQLDYGAGMPRPQSYHAQNGYTQSSSSGSYGYPQVPHSNQVIHYAPPQPHHQGMHPQYPPHQYPMTSPPAGYPAPQAYHPDQRMRHDAGNPANPHYRQSPYGQAQIVQYGPPPQGYFPPGYPGPHQYPAQYHPGMPAPYLPSFMHDWQVPSHSRVASPPTGKKDDEKGGIGAGPPPGVAQEDMILKIQELLLATNAEREAKEKERQLAIQSAEDQAAAIRKAEKERAADEARIKAEAIRQAKADAEAIAKAAAERADQEQRIREEAIRAAQKAIAEKAAADAEQAAREARIREEAARSALEAAAAEAKAKAEQEAKEKRIAADAAAEAKSAAEKKAAEDAAAKEEAAKTAKEEADKKLKEAEEAAAKAKAEAEAAQAAVAAAKPPDKKPPVRFKDAIGRNYNFPWERCCKWRDMENLIIQAFQHIEDLGEHVINGRYDLIGPDKEIIMPQYWDHIVQPDMHITMMLWPLPEKPPVPMDLPLPPPMPDVHFDLDDILNPGKKKKEKGKKPPGGGLASWMLGGTPRTRKPAKDKKKPDVAAWQHGTVI